MYYEDAEKLTTQMMRKHRTDCPDTNIFDNSNEFVYTFNCSCGESWEIDRDKVKGTKWDEIFSEEIGRMCYIESCSEPLNEEEIEVEERFASSKAFLNVAKKTMGKNDLKKAHESISNSIEFMMEVLQKKEKDREE